MACVKTTIVLPESLFKQVEALARELNISRSQLCTLALEEFIRRRQGLQLLEWINTAYDDEPDESEQTLRRGMRQQQRQILEGE